MNDALKVYNRCQGERIFFFFPKDFGEIMTSRDKRKKTARYSNYCQAEINYLQRHTLLATLCRNGARGDGQVGEPVTPRAAAL